MPVHSNVRNELRIFINYGNYKKKVLETDNLEFIIRKYHSLQKCSFSVLHRFLKSSRTQREALPRHCLLQ